MVTFCVAIGKYLVRPARRTTPLLPRRPTQLQHSVRTAAGQRAALHATSKEGKQSRSLHGVAQVDEGVEAARRSARGRAVEEGGEGRGARHGPIGGAVDGGEIVDEEGVAVGLEDGPHSFIENVSGGDRSGADTTAGHVASVGCISSVGTDVENSVSKLLSHTGTVCHRAKIDPLHVCGGPLPWQAPTRRQNNLSDFKPYKLVTGS